MRKELFLSGLELVRVLGVVGIDDSDDMKTGGAFVFRGCLAVVVLFYFVAFSTAIALDDSHGVFSCL